MPRILFSANFLEHDVYTCHVRLAFASARELQAFLQRNPASEKDGWSISIHQKAVRGYDGKPLHHADIRLATKLPPTPSPPLLTPPPQETADFTVREGVPINDYGTNHAEERPQEYLTWEQRDAFQKATKSLLLQLGVTDPGRWR